MNNAKNNKQRSQPNHKVSVIKRPFSQIRISDRLANKNLKAYKGNKNDTTLLNINFKTIFWGCLQEMIQAKQLNPYQQQKLIEYKNSPASFKSLIRLIYENNYQSQKENTKIKFRLQKLLKSNQIVKRILFNSGSFQIKLMMLKYLQALNYCVASKGFIVKWKSLRKIDVFQ